MKNLIAILGLLLTPFLASANFSLDDGKYYNHSIAKKVKINCTGNSIKAKGLVNYDWTRFRKTSRRVFVDRRGNSIRVIGRNTFEFRARNRNRVVVFHRDNYGSRIRHENYGCTSACGANCSIQHGQAGPRGGYDDYSGGGYDDYSGGGSYGYDVAPGIDGVWTSSRNDRDVIIERTNEGVRAKFIGGNRDWTYYRQDSYDRKEYYDNRGNRYVLRSGRELVWYSKQGGSPIVLRKIR